MSRFAEDIRPVLLAVTKLSAPDYREIDEAELRAELRTGGREYEYAAFVRLMFMLRDDDPGYLEWHRSASDGYKRIRLTGAGRQEVEGWPTSSGVSTADLAAFLSAIAEAAGAPDMSEDDRGRLRAVGSNLKAVPAGVATGLLTAWLKAQTGMP